MITYKLLRKRKDGTLGPLFVDQRLRIPLGETLTAREDIIPKGLKCRPGWHSCLEPHAPHLSTKGRVWCECLVHDYEIIPRPSSQGGEWVLSKDILIVREFPLLTYV